MIRAAPASGSAPGAAGRPRAHDTAVLASGRVGRVILGHALLPVRPGEEAAFEAAFEEATAIIAASPGFVDLSLSRCRERPGTYFLLVRWERLEDHTEGFRGSAGYERWRDLLHRFDDPFPLVEHFDPVLRA